MAEIQSKTLVLLDEFAKQGAEAREAVRLIKMAISSSEFLAIRLEDAIQRGYLKTLEIKDHADALATYNERDFKISLDPSIFIGGDGDSNIARLVFVLSHETNHAHARNPASADTHFDEFVSQVWKKVNTLDDNDYTSIIKTYLDSRRGIEASATIAGWNALRDWYRNGSGGSIDAAKFYGELHKIIPNCFVPTTSGFVPKSFIQVNADFSISVTESNKEAFGICYYDQQANTAGDDRVADAVTTLGYIIQSELSTHRDYDPATLIVDLAAIGLTYQQLLQQKLFFGHGLDPFVIKDTSSGSVIDRTVTSYGPWKTEYERKLAERQAELVAMIELVHLDEDALRRISQAGGLGGVVGSAIASALQIDNAGWKVLASATLQTAGENFAEAIAAGGFSAALPSGTIVEVLGDIDNEFTANLRGAASGAVSSFLVSELISALDLEGTLAEIGQTVANATLSQIIENAIQIAQHSSEVTSIFQGVNPTMLWTALASYVGTRLASELVEFDTTGGQIGAQIGTAIGAYAGYAAGVAWAQGGAQIGTTVAGPVGALVGAFVGYILGGLIGSFFAAKPQAWATLGWNEHLSEFTVMSAGSKHGGSSQAVAALGTAVTSSLNSVVEFVGAKVARVDSLSYFTLRMKGKTYHYESSSGFGSRNAEDVINYATHTALSATVGKLVGGNIFMKRALKANIAHVSSPSAFDVSTLYGDLAIARDYGLYLQDPTLVNALISFGSTSALAAQWMITLARAHELGLDKRADTDWVGGFTAHLDQIADGMLDGNAIVPSSMALELDEDNARIFNYLDSEGIVVYASGDTINSALKDFIIGSGGDDTIIIEGNTIGDANGLVIDGVVASGQHMINVAAVIDGGGGHDTIRGGDLGNDLVGGAGNDWLVGGVLDDWLLGGDGSDILFAGNVANIAFAVNDSAAESVAISTDGGNGNYLEGGTGNDRLYGGRGSDWLDGGAGNDRLVGGAGGDILQGGGGDDRGANGEAVLLGGAGSDQYIFGFGDGKDVIFDESDSAGAAGISRDSIAWRIQQMENGALTRNWAGGGDYEVDGSVKGGEDAIAFGAGITMANLLMRRSGNDLVIQLISLDASGNGALTGDELTILDWFESTRRVEWLRFANGEEIRLGDMTSFVIGTGESDVILGSYGADFLYGGGGDDEIRGLAGNDFGNGGSGNDFVAGDGDNDWVMGGSGDDQVIGGAGHDTVFGDDGDDRVYGGSGSDLVVGGRGNDEVVGGAGDDVFRYSRGDGQDVVMDDYVNNWDQVWQNGVYVNGYVLQSNGTVTKNGVVYFDGSKWLGQYDWDDENQVLKRHAGAVNGVVAADSGTDTLEFGVGIDIQDLMLGRSGNDLIVAVSEDQSAGGADQVSDRITIKDWYSLGAPIENFVFAATGRHAVSAMNLVGGSDGDDTLTGTAGNDWLTGNGGDDVIEGSHGEDILAGNAGADTLRGGAGVDVLFGGSGNDTLDGGAGADLLFGGDGIDIASYASSTRYAAFVYLKPEAAFASASEAKGDVFESIEGLEGTYAADHLGGDDDDNILKGGGGSDVLLGGGGSDIYVYEVGDSSDTIREGNYIVEEIRKANGEINSQLYTGNWEYLGYGATSQGDRHQYRLTVTRNGTNEVVYKSRDGMDFLYTALTPSMPLSGAWPAVGFQPGVAYARNNQNGEQVVRDVIQGGDGGSDMVQLGAGLSLSNISNVYKNASDLRVSLLPSTGQSGGLTLANHYVEGSEVEQIQFADGLTIDLMTLRLPAQATSGDDLMIGTTGTNTLHGLAGNDVLSGGDGTDSLFGDDGDDILEGGKDADSLDGGSDSVSLGLSAQAGVEYGDTIRYVTSDAAVIVDLAASTATGGHATGDTLV
ncbi:calcium-binding protein, partial [Luteimonas suaedae]|uniref:calcium-binding protein n=1 Tax=Luteimonas suaedae TaxID=2605430 RepID=UPI003CCDDC69